jgi:hypothetical protein
MGNFLLELLETLARTGRGLRHPQIGIERDNSLRRPAQRQRMLAQRILPCRRFPVLHDWTQR